MGEVLANCTFVPLGAELAGVRERRGSLGVFKGSSKANTEAAVRRRVLLVFIFIAKSLGLIRSERLRHYEPKNLDALVWNHFVQYSDTNHVNRAGMTLALRHLDGQAALIVETGSSAWGTNSSLLFDSYVREFGGIFFTVDVRAKAVEDLRPKLSERGTAFVGDSVEFLSKLSLPENFDHISLAYLDSCDLDIAEPDPSMQHGLREFNAIHPLLGRNSILVVDDTPIEACLLGEAAEAYFQSYGVVPGKGALILRSPLLNQYDVIYHHYCLVLRRK